MKVLEFLSFNKIKYFSLGLRLTKFLKNQRFFVKRSFKKVLYIFVRRSLKLFTKKNPQGGPQKMLLKN